MVMWLGSRSHTIVICTHVRQTFAKQTVNVSPSGSDFLHIVEARLFFTLCRKVWLCLSWLSALRDWLLARNKFTFTIVFGRTLPFLSIFQASEFTEQSIYYKEILFFYTLLFKSWKNPGEIYLLGSQSQNVAIFGPKILAVLKRRGKFFGGVFFDSFQQSEQESQP